MQYLMLTHIQVKICESWNLEGSCLFFNKDHMKSVLSLPISKLKTQTCFKDKSDRSNKQAIHRRKTFFTIWD